MTSICMYFEVHQPMRLNRFSVFNIGDNADASPNYFNNKLNHEIFEKVAKKCYLPTNNLLLNLINEFDGKFRISLVSLAHLLNTVNGLCLQSLTVLKNYLQQALLI